MLQEPVAQPTHIANAGEEQQALAKDKLYQWWYEVNADIESLRAWGLMLPQMLHLTHLTSNPRVRGLDFNSVVRTTLLPIESLPAWA